LLYYRQYINNNSDKWVTFIHGAGGSSSIWYKQVKEFKSHFNVLLIDLRGHGKSSKGSWKKGDTFFQISEEVLRVLNHLKIDSSHFIGISLGSIVIQTIAQLYPSRIQSMVLGGAIIKLDFRTNLLLSIGNIGKYIVPYIWLYQLFAWIIMPRNNHKKSRNEFVEQAKNMCQKEFIRWFSLTKALNPFLKRIQTKFLNIPTLFMMGEEDYLFLPPVEKLVSDEKKLNLKLFKIKNAGHICNIDKPALFNEVAIKFIYGIKQDEHNYIAFNY